MELGYHPSISDRLFLELNRSNFSFLVTNKELLPLRSGEFELVDVELLDQILKTNKIFDQIFSSVNLNIRGADFVLVPQDLSSDANRRDLFLMNYKLDPMSDLRSGFIGNAIEIVYRIPTELVQLLRNKFKNLEVKHELESLSKCWFGSVVNTMSHDMYASISQGKLLLAVRSKGKIVFANIFDINNSDDVFYYCMLTVEQLELDIERINIFWLIEDDRFQLDALQKQFQNYVNTVRPYLFDISGDVSKDEFVIAHQGMMAMLQCAS